QMLCVTCDNATNNTVMVENLAEALPSFSGRANHMRCFLHTINLVAKSLLKEFNMMKREATQALDNNVGSKSGESENEMENLPTDSYAAEGAEDDSLLGDNDEGWIDEVELLSECEHKQLWQQILPVKLVLVKVSKKKTLHTLITNSTISCSCARLHSNSYTPPPFSFLPGTRHSIC
ncbi:uncharacterized protein BJ212DRAFT_1287405, partial [Suillus subaureus]